MGLTWSSDGTWKKHLANIIQKAAKRIDMLRALKFKLQWKDLETIYFSFVRPIFEYACVVWDNTPRHDKYFCDMEKLQIQAARIVTGVNNYSSKILLYHDTGWEKLSERREKQRLVLSYKIINGLAPQHLINIFRSYNNHNQNH